jgi:hypothetical protein
MFFCIYVVFCVDFQTDLFFLQNFLSNVHKQILIVSEVHSQCLLWENDGEEDKKNGDLEVVMKKPRNGEVSSRPLPRLTDAMRYSKDSNSDTPTEKCLILPRGYSSDGFIASFTRWEVGGGH